MTQFPHVPIPGRYDPGVPPEVAAARFLHMMRQRRTVRHFSSRPVSRETIRHIVATAGSSPSGANKQPWRFVCVQDPEVKRRIREAAEEEETQFYTQRAGEAWLRDLEPLGTDASKPFLEIAPWLVVVFKLTRNDDGGNVYYINESVGIATGFLLAAAHASGLSTLTHTPSPMSFLNRVLQRPDYERPFLLIPMGYPADDATVPVAALERKPLDTIMVEI
jgi:nitroreductase